MLSRDPVISAANRDGNSWWQRLGAQPGARWAVIMLSALTLAALMAPWIAPYDPQRLFDPVLLKSRAISWSHPFGTDPYSRDLLSRVLIGSRVSLMLAVGAVALSTAIGTVVGVGAGYLGGLADRVVSRVMDVGLSIPRVLLLLTIVGLWRVPSLGVLVLILGLTGWMGLGRLVRSEIRALRSHERVVAATALGLRKRTIAWRHLMPDVLPLIAVSATMGIGQVLLLESGLSFLGLGVPAPLASWGTILLDVSDVIGPGRWLAFFPGLVLMLTVVSVHRIGDALQAAMDVKTRV